MLGGTQFVGRTLAEEAVGRGWEVTLFNRGRREAPAGVTVLTGDRTAGGLAVLADREWDVVVDTWAKAPSVVRDAARALADRAGQYVYISSLSVYADPLPAGGAEDSPLVDGSADAGDVEYPQAKRGGELAAEESFGGRALHVRAGVILGPYEDIGRLPWWLTRIARGGPVLAPGPSAAGIQYVDVRDLAAWVADAAESRLTGPYNMVSPPGHATMGELLEACVSATGSDADLRWTDPDTILAAGIQPWTELPIWVPPGDAYDTIFTANVDKALATGLRCRPLPETAADTWRWLQTLNGQDPTRPDRPAVGLDPAVEARVLQG